MLLNKVFFMATLYLQNTGSMNLEVKSLNLRIEKDILMVHADIKTTCYSMRKFHYTVAHCKVYFS